MRDATLLLALCVAWVGAMSIVHLTQGTANLEISTLLRPAIGSGVPQDVAVLTESRLPRMLAALLAGSALGMAGAGMQSITRNPLVSPETTGVGAGAYLALTVAALLGVSLSPLAGLGVAFIGGLAAAAAVIGLASSATDTGPLRLVLAGSALTMGLGSLTSVALLLHPWETQGMFVWGAGTLAQNGIGGVAAMAPIGVLAGIAIVLLGHRLDIMQLGDEAATSLGVPVAATRRWVVALAVVLTAAAVTVTGPIGFVGLCAPALVRLASRRLPVLRRQRLFLVASSFAAAGLLLFADVALRAIFGAVRGINVPVGALTSILGAVLLVLLTRSLPRREGDGESLAAMHAGKISTRMRRSVVAGAWLGLIATIVVALLVGDSVILLGDVWNWLQGLAAPRVSFIMETRTPRVLGAALAGMTLAVAGLLVQGATRNPLADPGILGVSAAAGVGAVAVITTSAHPTDQSIFAAASVGAATAVVLLFALARGDQLRLVLIGIAIGAAASAVITLLLIQSDPWDQTRAMTWLGGSTYGTTTGHLLPMAVLLALSCSALRLTHRDLDLVQFDDVTPRVLGVAVGRARLSHVALAAALTAAATASVGVLSFVGLIAPHAARLLVGKRHALVAPLTIAIGGLVVVAADAVGRAAFAPTQLPAGLVVAILGTPYFLWLLRSISD